jgi:hypothetical protein
VSIGSGSSTVPASGPQQYVASVWSSAVRYKRLVLSSTMQASGPQQYDASVKSLAVRCKRLLVIVGRTFGARSISRSVDRRRIGTIVRSGLVRSVAVRCQRLVLIGSWQYSASVRVACLSAQSLIGRVGLDQGPIV